VRRIVRFASYSPNCLKMSEDALPPPRETIADTATGARDPSGAELKEIALAFLRLGATAFGGPAVHIAMMEEEFVRRRGWVSRADFLDMLGASNLVPGPSSTEMAIHIGHQRGGWRGLVVAGVSFILPAMLIVMACAWVYVTFGSLHQMQSVLYGVKPVIIAIVLQALWGLGRTAFKNGYMVAVGLLATVAAIVAVNVLAILLAAGLATLFQAWIKERRLSKSLFVAPMPAKFLMASTPVLAAAVSVSLSALLVVFLKFGAVVFGSGYVLLAFLQADLVDRLHWLTQAQLLDAVAVGQVTPGPVFTTATFIGYLLGGVRGAVVATAGIFLPGFFFVAASRPLIPRIRRSKMAAAFLDGVNVGAVALMIALTWQLSRAALVDFSTCAIAALSALALIYFRINSASLIFLGGLIGLIASLWTAI
jgi:chromate transporter